MTWPNDRLRLKCTTKRCPRCRKRYVVNLATEDFHRSCRPNWFAEWGI